MKLRNEPIYVLQKQGHLIFVSATNEGYSGYRRKEHGANLRCLFKGGLGSEATLHMTLRWVNFANGTSSNLSQPEPYPWEELPYAACAKNETLDTQYEFRPVSGRLLAGHSLFFP
jgi:hypothetical protein